jgi:hypothetical protein
LDSADTNAVTAIRSIDPSTFKVNWTASVEHGVDDLQYNSQTGSIVATSGDQAAGATILDAKTGKVIQTAKFNKNPELRFVGASPGGEDIVLFEPRKLDVILVSEFAKGGVASARSFRLPDDVLKGTKEADSWVRQTVVGPKAVVLAQATSNNFAVVQWEAGRPPAQAA